MPTATPEPKDCGYTPCSGNSDCNGNLICVTANNGHNYCSEVAYADRCEQSPSYESCCTAPTSTPEPEPSPTVIIVVTNPPYATPLPTQPDQPQKYIVDTKSACNESCSSNADCKNMSHICYNGRCRLDVNPEDENCQLPSGETTVERVAQQPTELPQSGPKDWLKYLKAGIGAVGAGLLLILFL